MALNIYLNYYIDVQLLILKLLHVLVVINLIFFLFYLFQATLFVQI